MKKKLFAFPIFCMALFSSCHQKNESRVYMSNDSCFHVISFNPDGQYTSLRFFNLSEIADTVEYIPLQTNEDITVDKGRENTGALPTSPSTWTTAISAFSPTWTVPYLSMTRMESS